MKLPFLLCLFLHFSLGFDRFKRAQNRTYLGFEKESNSNWQGDFTFIQASDPQFGLVEYKLHNDTHIAEWDQERVNLRQAVREWNSLVPKPAFIAITGDLANAYPTNYSQLRRRQLDDLKAELEAVNSEIPLILLPGNHDVEDVATKQAIKEYSQEFGDDYYSFAVGGVAFVVINSQFYKNRDLVEELFEKQEEWLDQELEKIKKGQFTHVVVFQHIPWFRENVNEPDDEYFNIQTSDRKRLISKLHFSGVRHIFSGHVHRNLIGHFSDLEMVVTSSTGWQNNLDGVVTSAPGYRLIRVTQNQISQEYIEIGSSKSWQPGAGFWVIVSLLILAASVYLPNLFCGAN